MNFEPKVKIGDRVHIDFPGNPSEPPYKGFGIILERQGDFSATVKMGVPYNGQTLFRWGLCWVRCMNGIERVLDEI